MEPIKQVLARCPLFEGLTDSELDKIAGLCQEEVYETGATIFTEGEEARKLYIVEYGGVVLEMSIYLSPKSARRGAIDVITACQAFGWSAIAKSHTLTMSASCIEKTKVIALDGVGLQRSLEDSPRVGYEIMQKVVGLVYSRFSQARDTLAYILSITTHDLKAPLAAVESYLQVILGGYVGEITEKQKGMLQRSSQRIKELLNLIDNILDISRIDARELKMEPTSLLRVVENTRGIVKPLAWRKGVQLNVEVPEELSLINAAPDRLQQVFTNLLDNAIKFTPKGGAVTVKVSEQNDYILAEFIDTGIGIPTKELPRIFDDFYRGIKVNSTGAGLGLAIARRIIEAHGGIIWVESPCPESGIGSKFTLTLPKNRAIQGKKEEVLSHESRD